MGKASLLSTPEAKRSDAAPPVVRVRNFRKSYGKRLAVDGLDLELRTGEIYGLIGPDGSGKSSLMKAVSGVLSFDSGEVDVFGVRVDSEKAAERIKDRLGFMPQGLGLNLYPELSVEENIDFFARLRLVPEADLEERKERLLSMTRLASFRHRPMKNLSGGMKQKLGLVCTLIHQPQLVILDEPTTGVDPVSRRDFWAILTDLLREQGTTALVSTAYMDEASRFQQISLLFDGRVLAQGTPEEIVAMVPGTLVTLMAQPQVKALLQLKTVFQQAQALGPWLQVFVEGADSDSAKRQVQSALDGVEIGKLYASETDLENVFIALLRKQQGETRAVTAPVVGLM